MEDLAAVPYGGGPGLRGALTKAYLEGGNVAGPAGAAAANAGNRCKFNFNKIILTARKA